MTAEATETRVTAYFTLEGGSVHQFALDIGIFLGAGPPLPHYEPWRLAAIPQEVEPFGAARLMRWSVTEATMGTGEIVVVQPGGKLLIAFFGVGVVADINHSRRAVWMKAGGPAPSEV
jgi:hypothetical protein